MIDQRGFLWDLKARAFVWVEENSSLRLTGLEKKLSQARKPLLSKWSQCKLKECQMNPYALSHGVFIGEFRALVRKLSLIPLPMPKDRDIQFNCTR